MQATKKQMRRRPLPRKRVTPKPVHVFTDARRYAQEKLFSFLDLLFKESPKIKKSWKTIDTLLKEKIQNDLMTLWENTYHEHVEGEIAHNLEEIEKKIEQEAIEQFKAFIERQILYPCYDGVFKMIFLDETDHSLLIDLIKWTIFEGKKEILSIEIKCEEVKKDSFFEKTFVMDIFVITDDGEQCNIEVQLLNSLGLSSRMVAQLTKLHASQFYKGHRFAGKNPDPIMKTYSLWILPFDFTKEKDKFYHTIHLRYDHKPHKTFSQDISLHIYEFQKLLKLLKKKKISCLEGQFYWAEFLGIETDEDCRRVKERSPIMARATAKLESISKNSHSRAGFLSQSLKEMGLGVQHSVELMYEKLKSKAEGETIGEAIGKIRGKISLYVSIKYNTSEDFIENELYPIKSIEELSSLYQTIRESSLTEEKILEMISNLKQKHIKSS